jgi:hypothetical protein
MRSLLTILLAFLAACDFVSPKPVDYRKEVLDEVTRQTALWKGLGVHDYDFDYQRACACSVKATQPVNIHVRSDNIARVVDAQGADVAPQADIPWPTVDSLFKWSTEFLNLERYAVEVQFDTTLHYPIHLRGENPGVAVVQHESANLVQQTPGAPAIRSYLMAAPFSKSKSVTWRSR